MRCVPLSAALGRGDDRAGLGLLKVEDAVSVLAGGFGLVDGRFENLAMCTRCSMGFGV